MAYNRADVYCNRNPNFGYTSAVTDDGKDYFILPTYPAGFSGPQDPTAQRYMPAEKIVSQDVSCLEYNIYNQEYIRCDRYCDEAGTNDTETGKAMAQPDILDGWNADYNPTWWVAPVPPSTNAIYPTAEAQVTQDLYDRRDWFRQPDSYECYVDSPFMPIIEYVELYLVVTDDEDLELETEESIEGSEAILTLEFRSSIDIPDDLLGLEDQNADLQIEQQPLIIEME